MCKCTTLWTDMDEEHNTFNLHSERCTNPPCERLWMLLARLECLLKPPTTQRLAYDNPLEWLIKFNSKLFHGCIQSIEPYTRYLSHLDNL